MVCQYEATARVMSSGFLPPLSSHTCNHSGIKTSNISWVLVETCIFGPARQRTSTLLTFCQDRDEWMQYGTSHPTESLNNTRQEWEERSGVGERVFCLKIPNIIQSLDTGYQHRLTMWIIVIRAPEVQSKPRWYTSPVSTTVIMQLSHAKHD